MGDKCEKRNRHAITLESKIKVISLSDKGLSQAEIGRRLSLPRSTVSTVIKSKQQILDEVKNDAPMTRTIIRKKDSLLVDMERVLLIWIDDQTNRHLPLSLAIIQNKAQSLFDDLKAKRGEAAKDTEFGASRGWFERFKKRSNPLNIKIQGEASAADTLAAEKFPEYLAKIIDECGYTKDQIFNVDETGLFWKKMPSRTFIAQDEQLMPGFKPAKDRLTLLLGANASGNLKLKPLLIYHSENLTALENVKNSLPVHWRSYAKGWVTAALFEDWFNTCFVPEVEIYCKEKNIPFKILLIVDNAPGHPKTLDGLHPNISVIFLPPNTTSLLQPMEQNVVASFKLYYLSRIFSKCIIALGIEEEARQEIKKFWDSFMLLDGIKTIQDAWNDVKSSTLKRAWNKLYPQFPDDFEDLENSDPDVTENILEMARQLDLEVDAEDVAELIDSHSQSLSNEDLLTFDEQRRKIIAREIDLKMKEKPSPQKDSPHQASFLKSQFDHFVLMKEEPFDMDEDQIFIKEEQEEYDEDDVAVKIEPLQFLEAHSEDQSIYEASYSEYMDSEQNEIMNEEMREDGSSYERRLKNKRDAVRKSKMQRAKMGQKYTPISKKYKYSDPRNISANCLQVRDPKGRRQRDDYGEDNLEKRQRIKMNHLQQERRKNKQRKESTDLKLLEMIIKNENANAVPSQLHPIDAFLKSIAPSLKNLSPYSLNLAKSKIFNIVQEYELAILTQQEPTISGNRMDQMLPTNSSCYLFQNTSKSTPSSRDPPDHELSPRIPD